MTDTHLATLNDLLSQLRGLSPSEGDAHQIARILAQLPAAPSRLDQVEMIGVMWDYALAGLDREGRATLGWMVAAWVFRDDAVLAGEALRGMRVVMWPLIF